MSRPLALLTLLAVLVAGCGGGDGDGAASSTPTEASEPAARVDFPSTENKTIRALRADVPDGAVFAPGMSQLTVGRNRVAFALFDVSRKQLEPDAVAVYFAQPDGRRLRGPFVARRETLAVKPQFRSRQTQADLEDVDTFYVADVDFPRQGRFVVTALASTDGELMSSSQFEMNVTRTDGGPPEVGEPAPKAHTQTLQDVGGDLAQIDTRLPPLAENHEADFADVVGKEPIVLALATPQLCQTRVCGPVVDVALEALSGNDRVRFIHQEVFVDNDIQKGYRQEFAAWRLPTEPWLFVVGRDGKVVERFEGPVSVREVRAAVSRLG